MAAQECRKWCCHSLPPPPPPPPAVLSSARPFCLLSQAWGSSALSGLGRSRQYPAQECDLWTPNDTHTGAQRKHTGCQKHTENENPKQRLSAAKWTKKKNSHGHIIFKTILSSVFPHLRPSIPLSCYLRQFMFTSLSYPVLICSFFLSLQGAIIIHEVYEEGAASKDGRLWAGDQILEVRCGIMSIAYDLDKKGLTETWRPEEF